MIYGLNTGAFIEHGPAVTAIEHREARSASRFWRALDGERRLNLVEQALKPANDLIDEYPLAL